MMAEDTQKTSGSPSKRRRKPREEPTETCFVISPFGGWFDQYYESVFRPAVEAADLLPQRADNLFRSSDIVGDIWHMVTECRVALAELTNRNPNVFYELGLAHAARKPVLLLSQDIDDVPFDLRALRTIVYDLRDPRWGQLLKTKITKGLRETLSSPEEAVLPTFLREKSDSGPSVHSEEKRYLELRHEFETLRAEVHGWNVDVNTPPRQTSDTLSAVEISWLQELARGLTIRQLANRTGYSERAMYRLLQRTYSQIGVSNRTAALLYAREQGWL